MDFREKQKKKLTLTTRKKSIAKQRTLFKSKYKIIFINKKAEEEKNWKINVYIFVLNKQTKHRIEILNHGKDDRTKFKRKQIENQTQNTGICTVEKTEKENKNAKSQWQT